MSRLAAALEDDDPTSALWRLGQALGAPRSLAALGLTEPDVDHVATNAPSSSVGARQNVIPSHVSSSASATGSPAPSSTRPDTLTPSAGVIGSSPIAK